ncbi:MAG: hypothetical protein M0R33_15875 [Methylomonas sp.]|jgi:hypothetical protein|uniref:hypothetical protein n=1 Tax=Methylomonas sp. TaxID=418 RepID=UPI0026007BBD|nr:hypothetical protein [Methylomonas sp.]MCK9607921.1 hypothetical protein [Methylomonas sp.]
MPNLLVWIPDVYPTKINRFVTIKRQGKTGVKIVDLADDTLKFHYKLLVEACQFNVADIVDRALPLRMTLRRQLSSAGCQASVTTVNPLSAGNQRIVAS